MEDYEEWFKKEGLPEELCYQAFIARATAEGLMVKPRKKAEPKPIDPKIIALFDIFWNAGMRKAGDKQEALRTFDKLIRDDPSPTNTTHFFISDIHRRLKANVLGFDAMHPKTYLNGKRWNDEIVETKLKLPSNILEVQDLAVDNGVRIANAGEDPWVYRDFVKAEFDRMGI